jgi:hypothetical protein
MSITAGHVLQSPVWESSRRVATELVRIWQRTLVAAALARLRLAPVIIRNVVMATALI